MKAKGGNIHKGGQERMNEIMNGRTSIRMIKVMTEEREGTGGQKGPKEGEKKSD